MQIYIYDLSIFNNGEVFSILNALLHIVTANKFRYNTFIHCFYCWNNCGVAYNSLYMVLCSCLEWKVGA